MSETIETFGILKDLRKARRAAFGVKCPRCVSGRPKAMPTILLPQRRCRLDGYRDPRPEMSTEEEAAGLAPYGFTIEDIK